jgi:hypothetical protein
VCWRGVHTHTGKKHESDKKCIMHARHGDHEMTQSSCFPWAFSRSPTPAATRLCVEVRFFSSWSARRGGGQTRSNQDQPAEASPARANLTKPPDSQTATLC